MDVTVSSLALEAGGADIRAVPMDDPFAATLEAFRRLVPHGRVSAVARELHISPAHLHGILKGESDAGPENRSKIARFVADHGSVAAPTEPGLDADPGRSSLTVPVSPLRHARGLEVTVTVPTPSHAALSNLLSMLPVPVILAMIPEVAKRVEEELRKALPPAQPPKE